MYCLSFAYDLHMHLTKEMKTLVVLIPMFWDTPAGGLGFSCHWPNAVLERSESKTNQMLS